MNSSKVRMVTVMAEVKEDKLLDARNLACPMPVIKTKKALKELESGQVLHVIATDPGSVNDFESWTRSTGNELLLSKQEGKEYHFWIKKK